MALAPLQSSTKRHGSWGKPQETTSKGDSKEQQLVGKQTCLLSDASWLRYACDGFLPALLALGEGGNDATQIIPIALWETPELAAHSVTL